MGQTGQHQVTLGAGGLGLAVTLMGLDHDPRPQLPAPVLSPSQASSCLTPPSPAILPPHFGQVCYAVLATQRTFNQDD